MKCARCKKEYAPKELRPPSGLLRCIAFPALFFLLFRSKALQKEYSALYCGKCRRQLNFCFFFVGFGVVMIFICWLANKIDFIKLLSRFF